MTGSIIELNNAFDDVNDKIYKIQECMKGPTVVLVWAVWCPHCQVMKPDWDMLKPDITRQ